MRTRSAAPLSLALLACLATSCSTTSGQRDAAAAPAAEAGRSHGDDSSKRAALERDLAIAKLRLNHAKLEQERKQASAHKAVGFAEEELEMERAKKVQFETLDAPNRRARAELSLKRARDQRAEAAEELKQLEIMYDEQDLQDMTAEFVISRGKRNAERAERSLAIQEKELEALTGHTVPREQRGMELAVAKKESALESAKADAEAGRMAAEIAVLKAESEVAGLEEKLKKLETGAEQ